MNLVDLAQQNSSLTDQNHGDLEGHASQKKPVASCRFATPAVIAKAIVRFFPLWKGGVSLALAIPPIWPIYAITAGRVTTPANMPRPMNLLSMCLKHWPNAASTVTLIMLGHLPWGVFLKKTGFWSHL